jgi:hypothetical protein
MPDRPSGSARKLSGAVRARPHDLDRVGHVDESLGGGDANRPPLHRSLSDLDRTTARPAHQVVVVLVAAAPAIEGLTVLGAKTVHLARVGESPELVVDRRAPDPFAAPSQLRVEILGAKEAVGLLEHGRERPLLWG